MPLEILPTHATRICNQSGHNGLICSAPGEIQARRTRMCAGRTLVNPALAHHHPSPNDSPPDLEGGTTIADACGSLWWGRDAEVESKPAGGPARQSQPAASNDKTVTSKKIGLRNENSRGNDEVEAKIY